jgi:two-component system response regulator DevR
MNVPGFSRLGGIKIALILFVEHHRAFRQTASVMMNQEPDLEVVSQAGSVAEGRQKMAQGAIDAAIVDMPLPDEGGAGGAELVRELHETNPSIPVLVLTHLEDQEGLYEKFLKAGASEVLPKTIGLQEMVAAVRRLGGGEG